MRHALCPACRALLDVRDEWLGGKAECGGCGVVFAVPTNLPHAVAWDDRKAGRPRYARSGRRLRPAPEPPDDTDGTTMHRPRRGQGSAVTAMVLGIVAVVVGMPAGLCFCPIIMTVPSALALVFGFLGLRSEGRGMAIAGLVMGAVAQLLAAALVLYYGSFPQVMKWMAAPPAAGPGAGGPAFTTPATKKK